MGENVLVVCNYDSPAPAYTHTHTPNPPLTKTSPSFLLIGLRVKRENGWGECVRGVGGVNVTFFSLSPSREIPKTRWGGLVSLALLTKEPQFSLLLDSLHISTVITLIEAKLDRIKVLRKH